MKINIMKKSTSLFLLCLLYAGANKTIQAVDGNTIVVAANIVSMQNEKHDLLFLKEALNNLKIFLIKRTQQNFKKIITEKNKFQPRTPLGTEFKNFLDIAINDFLKNIQPLKGIKISRNKDFVEKTIFKAFDLLEKQFEQLEETIKATNSSPHILTALKKMGDELIQIKIKYGLNTKPQNTGFFGKVAALAKKPNDTRKKVLLAIAIQKLTRLQI